MDVYSQKPTEITGNHCCCSSLGADLTRFVVSASLGTVFRIRDWPDLSCTRHLQRDWVALFPWYLAGSSPAIASLTASSLNICGIEYDRRVLQQ